MSQRAGRAGSLTVEDGEAIRTDLTHGFQLVQEAAVHHAQSGAPEAGLALIEELLTESRYRSETLEWDAITLYSWTEHYEQAIALYERLKRHDPLPAYVVKATAKAYRAQGQHDRAAALYARLLSLTPQDTDARLGAFGTALDRGRDAEALEHLEVLVQADPGHPDYQVWRIELLWRLGHHREAFAALRGVWAVGLLFVAVILSIYFGIVTATEAAAAGALLTAIIGLARRRLTLVTLLDSLVEALRTSVAIYVVLIGATLFGYFLAITQAPEDLPQFLTELTEGGN